MLKKQSSKIRSKSFSTMQRNMALWTSKFQVPSELFNKDDEQLIATAWPLILSDDDLQDFITNWPTYWTFSQNFIISSSTIPGLETVESSGQIVWGNRMDSPYYNMVNPELPPLNPRPIMPAIWLTDSELEAAYRTNLSPSLSIII